MNIVTENVPTTFFRTRISDNTVSIEQNGVYENFSVQLKEVAIENVKTEIYKKFGVNVNSTNSNEECLIPNDVLYRMNSDTGLREKVFAVLADHSNAKCTLAGYNPPVKKYTLIFDKNGDVVTYILEPDTETIEKEIVKTRKHKIIFDRLVWNTFDYNNINSSLFQDIELQNLMSQTVLIKKEKKLL